MVTNAPDDETTSVADRLATVELCLAALIAAHFRNAPDPGSTLDLYEAGIRRSIEEACVQAIEEARIEMPEGLAEQVVRAGERRAEAMAASVSHLLGRARRLLDQR